MTKKTNRYRYRQHDGIQSQQEADIKAAYPQLQFKPPALAYVSPHDYYPDFLLGRLASGHPVYLEAKEWMQCSDIPKYKAVLTSNPHVHLRFLIVAAPTKVFTDLAQLPRTKVHCANYTLPAEWLEEVSGARVEPVRDATNAHAPSVGSLQRQSDD